MILAELEVYHSRPIAPTRRIAIGRTVLPTEPPPGFGGILLGGVVARNVGFLDDDNMEDLVSLLTQLEGGHRVPQPRLRYRLQVDRVGLQLSAHRLHGEGERLWFEFDDGKGEPPQQVLGAVYAAGRMPAAVRGPVISAVRRSLGWTGPVGDDLIRTLAGFSRGSMLGDLSSLALADPVGWALHVLGFAAEGAGRGPGADGHGKADEEGVTPTPSKQAIQKRFREALMSAHPDHGGLSDDAAKRIGDLTQARRILLGS